MRILFDSKSDIHKKPFGCLKPGEKCRICIHVPSSCEAGRVDLIMEKDGGETSSYLLKKEKTEDSYDFFSGEFALLDCGLYFYYFNIETPQSAFKLMKYGESDTNIEEGNKWQLSCVPEKYEKKADFEGKVMYQIFPDRFAKSGACSLDGKLEPYRIHESESELPDFMPNEEGKILNNDFFGGNLKGIEENLGYLKDLGVGIIYLNPIFFAYSNHRYDTSDYKKVDPMLGNEEDFSSLCKGAHEKGIKIILDGVFSHTGSDSIYFDKMSRFGNGAYSNPNSPYRSWYDFESYPEKYTSWWGIDTLPCTNELDKSYIEYILTGDDSVVKHWLRLGADGFRLDVADELPDEFIRILTETVKAEKKDAFVIGEVWEDASNKIAYGVRRKYFTDAELDSVMNYPFRTAIIDFVMGRITAEQFSASVMTVAENYPKEVINCLMNSLSTHDTTRILTVLTGAEQNLSREEKARYEFTKEERQRAAFLIKPAVFLQFFLPGTACIYYGDEAGMEGFNDPFNRAFFARDDKCELFNFYKAMAKLKNSLLPLKDGDIRFVSTSGGSFTALRRSGEEEVFAAVNFSDEAIEINSKKFHITHNCTCFENKVYVQKGGFALYE